MGIKKIWFICLLLAVGGCGDSDSNGGGGAGGGGGNACDAVTVTDFFVALDGTVDFTAVDASAQYGDPANTDGAFVDGNIYKVTFSSDQSADIQMETTYKKFEFDAAKGDLFGSNDQEVGVRMIRDGVWLLIQQPCEDPTDKLFISYRKDDEASGSDFNWRLDS